MGGIAIVLFAGLTAIALISQVHYAEDPCNLIGWAECATEPQPSLIAQVAAATFGDSSVFFYVIQATTALVLLLAANTAFNGFPLLGSVLARDGYAPKSLSTRGDRLIYSNGVVILALAASVILVVFQANLTVLIQLYIIGVFVSFTLGQTGMVRHWLRELSLRRHPAGKAKRPPTRTDADERPLSQGAILRALVINAIGAGDDRGRAHRRDGHEVHPRRVDRVRDDADPLLPHDGREPVLPRRREGDRGRPDDDLRRDRRPRDRARGPHAEADAEGPRLRDRRPPRLARGRARLDRRRRPRSSSRRTGSSRTST